MTEPDPPERDVPPGQYPPAPSYPPASYPPASYPVPPYWTGGSVPPVYPPPPGLMYPVVPRPRASGRAIAVLILGIAGVAITAACCLGWIAGIVALSLAPGARREIRDSYGTVTGTGLVTAGVVCAWVSIGLAVVGAWAWLLVTVVSGLGSVPVMPPTF